MQDKVKDLQVLLEDSLQTSLIFALKITNKRKGKDLVLLNVLKVNHKDNQRKLQRRGYLSFHHYLAKSLKEKVEATIIIIRFKASSKYPSRLYLIRTDIIKHIV